MDLQNSLNSCSLPEEFPTKLKRAVGGFTKDGPLLCGGYNSDTDTISNDCFILNNAKFFETEVNLKTARERASAVVLPNGELWIHGGGNFGRLWSSEKISLQASEYGLQLGKKIAGHCSMLINSTTAFISGGYMGFGASTSETYFVDIHNWKSIKGPYMEEARRDHGCALFRHNNHNYAFVAGGIVATTDQSTTSSTEILDLDSQVLEWTKGKCHQSLHRQINSWFRN